MKQLLGTILMPALLLVVACDPGMTIRQTEGASEATSGVAEPDVALRVKTSHPFIGETWYAPEVVLTNSYGAPVTVTGVDLVTESATYPNKPPQPGTYPAVVPPGRTEGLLVWFDLNDPVNKTFFKKLARLRVHNRIGSREETVEAGIVGGTLQLGD